MSALTSADHASMSTEEEAVEEVEVEEEDYKKDWLNTATLNRCPRWSE